MKPPHYMIPYNPYWRYSLYPFLFFLLLIPPVQAQEDLDVIEDLMTAIEEVPHYDREKWKAIRNLRMELANLSPEDLEGQYDLQLELLNEYRVFRQDSAFFYGLQNRELAEKMDREDLVDRAILNLADITVSAGMYKEALDYLRFLQAADLPRDVRSLYYGLLGRCYDEMAEYNNLKHFSETYEELARKYRGKALELTEPGTFFNRFLKGFMTYKNGDLEEAKDIFLTLFRSALSLREEALLHYTLGDIYFQLGNEDAAITYFARAAIADIKTSTKENLAMLRLSELMFKSGNIKEASIFIHKANIDASFYGAQQRKIRVGAILPIIEEEVINMMEEQRSLLVTQNVVVTVLLLFVLVLAIIIYTQVRSLKEARTVIERAHENLKRTVEEVTRNNERIKIQNKELNRMNHLLLEANKIKEEYIGFFFTQDADIFEKFRDFKQKVETHVGKQDLDKVSYLLRTYDLKKEKEKLLKNFDEAFIKLFPNFIEEFNSLLIPGEEISVRKGKILNKELRIFALIRLGIHHNEIIARILGYSVNSIYTYKTKIRNKSPFPKKDFERKLFENTTLKL